MATTVRAYFLVVLAFALLGSQTEAAQRIGNEKDFSHVAWFDLAANGEPIGRLELGLFGNDVPNTVKNFINLINGHDFKGNYGQMGYKGTKFHRIISGFMMQGGDIEHKKGAGGFSTLEPGQRKFNDENFVFKHRAGSLSMANAGPNTNGSQFFVTFVETNWLDGKHVVFGHIANDDIRGVLTKVEGMGTQSGTPTKDIVVTDCGVEAIA